MREFEGEHLIKNLRTEFEPFYRQLLCLELQKKNIKLSNWKLQWIVTTKYESPSTEELQEMERVKACNEEVMRSHASDWKELYIVKLKAL